MRCRVAILPRIQGKDGTMFQIGVAPRAVTDDAKLDAILQLRPVIDVRAMANPFDSHFTQGTVDKLCEKGGTRGTVQTWTVANGEAQQLIKLYAAALVAYISRAQTADVANARAQLSARTFAQVVYVDKDGTYAAKPGKGRVALFVTRYYSTNQTLHITPAAQSALDKRIAELKRAEQSAQKPVASRNATIAKAAESKADKPKAKRSGVKLAKADRPVCNGKPDDGCIEAVRATANVAAS